MVKDFESRARFLIYPILRFLFLTILLVVVVIM